MTVPSRDTALDVPVFHLAWQVSGDELVAVEADPDTADLRASVRVDGDEMRERA
jgi:hypothetical protein